ncbi:MAG: very short patch repair endonuclease [Chloroflexota bacterium]|nr:very short patch repair endonuclease [Chloroflexota bacterium]MDE2885135.1 very short patch repair endonuclease [Chloroflexota bacterium]
MRANRRSDTKPEVALRSLLHRSGLRFRKDYAIRRPDGKAVHCDIAFTGKRVAVFVDGCFWHLCPDHGRIPKSNQAYWIPKLQRNVDRDRATDSGLREAGWRVLRLWEHVSPEDASVEVLRLLAEV